MTYPCSFPLSSLILVSWLMYKYQFPVPRLSLPAGGLLWGTRKVSQDDGEVKCVPTYVKVVYPQSILVIVILFTR